MAELLQLDAAAARAGKSEVTLRRLIKAGKIPAHKEKTLTGFIYMVDPDHIRAYYAGKAEDIPESVTPAPETEAPATEKKEAIPSASANEGRRVAIATDSTSPNEYWQKRAENYEHKYYQELEKNATAREELGVWRGRAEHAQAMLMKMLPAAPEVVQSEKTVAEPKKEATGGFPLLTFLVVLVTLCFFILAGAVAYSVFWR